MNLLIEYIYTLTSNFKLLNTTTLIPTFIPTIIMLIEEEWAVNISKYKCKINAGKVIKNEPVEFI